MAYGTEWVLYKDFIHILFPYNLLSLIAQYYPTKPVLLVIPAFSDLKEDGIRNHKKFRLNSIILV